MSTETGLVRLYVLAVLYDVQPPAMIYFCSLKQRLIHRFICIGSSCAVRLPVIPPQVILCPQGFPSSGGKV